jgi:hypothetical protein
MTEHKDFDKFEDKEKGYRKDRNHFNPSEEGIYRKNSKKIQKSKRNYKEVYKNVNSISRTLEGIIKTGKCTFIDADILLNCSAELLLALYKINENHLNQAYFPHIKEVDEEELNRSILRFIRNTRYLDLDEIIFKIHNGKKIKDQVGDLIDKSLLSLYKKDILVGFGERNTEFIHLSTFIHTICFAWVTARGFKDEIIYSDGNYIYLNETEIELLNDILSIVSLTGNFSNNFALTDLFPVERKLSAYAVEVEKLEKKDWKEKTEYLINSLSKLSEENRTFSTLEKYIFEAAVRLLVLDLKKLNESVDDNKMELEILDSYFHAFFEYLCGNDEKFKENIEETKRKILKVSYSIDFERFKKDIPKEGRD